MRESIKGNYYGLYENGEQVFVGYTNDIKKWIGTTSNVHLKKYAEQGGRLCRKYEVKKLDPPKEEEVIIEPEYEYQFVLNHIIHDGNSIVNKKDRLEEVLSYLKEKGYESIARYVPKTKYEKEFWVIERCH